MRNQKTVPSDAEIVARLNDMIPSERMELLGQLTHWQEVTRREDSAEVCRERDRARRSLTRSNARVLKLEAILGAASAVVEAIDQYGRNRITWGALVGENSRLRKSLVALVTKDKGVPKEKRPCLPG